MFIIRTSNLETNSNLHVEYFSCYKLQYVNYANLLTVRMFVAWSIVHETLSRIDSPLSWLSIPCQNRTVWHPACRSYWRIRFHRMGHLARSVEPAHFTRYVIGFYSPMLLTTESCLAPYVQQDLVLGHAMIYAKLSVHSTDSIYLFAWWESKPVTSSWP